jgi:hypothetical protein
MRANYIQDELITFKGLKIYSMPWVPIHFSNLDPNAFKSKDINLYTTAIESIPAETDILVTWNHCYMHKNCTNISDQGDIYLNKKINTLKNLKIHAFGQMVEDTVIQNATSHLVVCANRSHVGNYTTVQI